jgi:hypothetical protein
MAHYALLNEQGVVTSVIVGKDEDGSVDWEAYYAEKTGLACKRTSYNTRAGAHLKGGTPYRKNYAAKEFLYDAARNAFIPPQPFPSWTLDEQSCTWVAPTPMPPGGPHVWNEEQQAWVAMPTRPEPKE